MSFGEIIRWPFGALLRVFYGWFDNYAIALLLFAIVVKIILLPLSIKQQKTQIGAAKMRPQIAAIEKKYAGRNDQKTLQKKQQEIMALQQAAGYSPLAGCLPLLIQLPIILILYNIIQRPLTYISNLSADAITTIRTTLNGFLETPLSEKITEIQLLGQFRTLNVPGNDMSAIGAETIGKLNEINLNLFGLDLTVTPSLTNMSWLVVIPILTFVASFISMKLSRKFMGNATQAATPESRTSNIIMDLMMPAMSLFFAFSLPAALGVYWIYQSVLGVAQQYALSKAMPLPTYTAEEIREMEKAAKERAKQNASQAAAARPGSLHHIDDEDVIDVDQLPVIRSKFDEDDDLPPSPPKPKKAPSPTQNKKKKKK